MVERFCVCAVFKKLSFELLNLYPVRKVRLKYVLPFFQRLGMHRANSSNVHQMMHESKVCAYSYLIGTFIFMCAHAVMFRWGLVLLSLCVRMQ